MKQVRLTKTYLSTLIATSCFTNGGYVDVRGTVADYGVEWENRLQDQLGPWLQEQPAGGLYLLLSAYYPVIDAYAVIGICAYRWALPVVMCNDLP